MALVTSGNCSRKREMPPTHAQSTVELHSALKAASLGTEPCGSWGALQKWWPSLLHRALQQAPRDRAAPSHSWAAGKPLLISTAGGVQETRKKCSCPGVKHRPYLWAHLHICTGFPEVRWGEASEGFGAGLTDGGQLVGATASQIPAPREWMPPGWGCALGLWALSFGKAAMPAGKQGVLLGSPGRREKKVMRNKTCSTK